MNNNAILRFVEACESAVRVSDTLSKGNNRVARVHETYRNAMLAVKDAGVLDHVCPHLDDTLNTVLEFLRAYEKADIAYRNWMGRLNRPRGYISPKAEPAAPPLFAAQSEYYQFRQAATTLSRKAILIDGIASDEPHSLTNDELLVLEALVESRRRMFVADIEAVIKRSDKTVRKIVKTLIGLGLAERDAGANTGVAATPDGIEFYESTQKRTA